MAKQKDPLDEFHLRLQAMCHARGIKNASQLAARLNKAPASRVSLTGAYGWWDGKRMPDLPNTVAIIRLLRGSADYLIMGEGAMFPLEHGRSW